jgi:mono/diheme cytochrome c family protein
MSGRHGFNISVFSILCGLLLALVSACSQERPPVRGFVLPEGDIAQGEQVFIDFNCQSCHSIPGMEFPETEFKAPFVVSLGGEVYRVRNYGELLTAIVNPDHIISPKYIAMLNRADREAVVSPMPYYGEEMTVAELIDLVEFLHAQYSRLQPEWYNGYYLNK